MLATLPLTIAPASAFLSPVRRTREPAARLTDAWLAEAKDGLVQMLRSDHPWVEQSLAVFTVLSGNAPPMPRAKSWWHGEYTLRSSRAVVEAVEALSQQHFSLNGHVNIQAGASSSEALEVSIPLDGGVVMHLSGSLLHRTIDGDKSGGLFTATLDASELVMTTRTPAAAEALQDCEGAMGARLPRADTPWKVRLRPLFVDDDLLLLRETSRPKGRDLLLVVLTRRLTDDECAEEEERDDKAVVETARDAATDTAQEAAAAGAARQRINRDEWIAQRSGTVQAPATSAEGTATAMEAPPPQPSETAEEEASFSSLMNCARELRSSWEAIDTPRVDGLPADVAALLGGRLLIGPYPIPILPPGATPALAKLDYLRRVLAVGGACFVSLEDELPWQLERWPQDGQRRHARYAPYADAHHRKLARVELTYLYCPMVAGAAPADGLGAGSSILSLLGQLLSHYESGGRGAVYVHCVEADAGRAALVGACTLSLFHPTLSHAAIWQRVEDAYAARPMPAAPPSLTEVQRRFLQSFVSAVRCWERAPLAPDLRRPLI